jgi:anti-sigma regulatory factor (Ser/Thr protein kinase)
VPVWPLRKRIRLAPEATAPRRARDFLAAVCAGWNERRYTEVGGLVLSELVSNAVRHTGTEIEVRLQLAGDRLRIEVHDGGSGQPRVVPPERRTIGGNGLDIVSRLAESWGVSPDGDGGKSVWCVLAPEG